MAFLMVIFGIIIVVLFLIGLAKIRFDIFEDDKNLFKMNKNLFETNKNLRIMI